MFHKCLSIELILVTEHLRMFLGRYCEKQLFITPRGNIGTFCTFLNHTPDFSGNSLSCPDLPCDLSVDLAHKKMFNACHNLC